MNILYVNTTFWGGGAEKVARQLYSEMAKRGHKTFFMSGRYQPKLTEDIDVICNNFFERFFSGLSGVLKHNFLYGNPIASHKIIRKIHADNIDILHIHNLHGNYIGPRDIDRITRKCPKVKIIITMHDMWLLTGCCTHGMECTKWKSGCSDCKGNAIHKKGIPGAYKYWTAKAKAFTKHSVTFVSPSRWLVDKCNEGMLRTEEIVLINNGIDADEFVSYDKAEIRKELGIPTDKRVLLFSAHNIYSPYKGFKYLLDSLAHLPDKEKYFLIVIGNGVDGIDIPFEMQKYGYISSTQLMNKIYSAADLFLNPSMADTFPLTVLESMAAGTAVVSFKTGGIPEEIEPEVGWLIEQADSKAFCDAICVACESGDVDKKNSICRDYVIQGFPLTKMLDEYDKLYKEVINE